MTWVAWRQFRIQALVTLGLLAAFAVLVLVTGLNLHSLYSSLGGKHCIARNGCMQLTSYDKPLADLLGPVLLAIPALLGIFWGAPLVAREFESGTYRLAWTQGVTRRRWLLVRVALVGVAALAVAGVASWLVSWWFAPLDAVNMNRFDPSVFSERGVVTIGYVGFAFALGVAAGTMTRRTLPAMATTLVGFVAARLAVTFWVRPHLLVASKSVVPLTFGHGLGYFSSPLGVFVAPDTFHLPNSWLLSDTLVDRTHHAIGTAQLHDLLVRVCPAVVHPQGPPTKGLNAAGIACAHSLSHHLQRLLTYQPPGHYWPLQAIEAGIFLAAAFALICAAIWRVGPARRTPGARRGHPASNGQGAQTNPYPLRSREPSVRRQVTDWQPCSDGPHHLLFGLPSGSARCARGMGSRRATRPWEHG